MDEGPGKTEIDTRLDTLRAAHRALDQRIAQIAVEGSRDEVELQRLKKQKQDCMVIQAGALKMASG